MGHHHHGHPSAGQLTHRIQHFLHATRIESTGGFIKQHHLRVKSESPGDRDPLLLTTTELRWVLLRLFLNAHLLVSPAPAAPPPPWPLLHLHRCKGDVVEDREMGEEIEPLKHHAHPTADRPHLWLSMR